MARPRVRDDLLVGDLGKMREVREGKWRGDLREEAVIAETAEGDRLVKIASIDAEFRV